MKLRILFLPLAGLFVVLGAISAFRGINGDYEKLLQSAWQFFLAIVSVRTYFHYEKKSQK
jgi:hypothetical protein